MSELVRRQRPSERTTAAPSVAPVQEPEISTAGRAGKAAAEGRVEGQPIPADMRASLLARVRGSATLRGVLDEVGKDFPIVWGRATYHANGTIYLDARKDEADGSFMHELEHLRAFVQNERPSVRKLDRETFVARSMDGEIAAHAQAYVGLHELGKTRYADLAGYNDFQAFLRREHPDLAKRRSGAIDSAVQSTLLMDVAKAWVRTQMETNPKWHTSVSEADHAEHYGAIWDQHH
ncbi:MAG: hypothetical protein KC656_24015 [Myxococcales bacterium]|nr:hypothetical protein [Myxococcales bacterium]